MAKIKILMKFGDDGWARRMILIEVSNIYE
jgi:hypothetical protein